MLTRRYKPISKISFDRKYSQYLSLICYNIRNMNKHNGYNTVQKNIKKQITFLSWFAFILGALNVVILGNHCFINNI
jgi:hypothetical protein